MPSQVIALKYRPKTFEDLIGQEMISNTLSLALNTNKLSHAYLFSGLRGSGKTSTARIFAKSMLCVNGPTSKPCEQCDNCKNANDNKHTDIIELDAASHRGIDDIRELIEHSKYTPSMGRFKIFIIDEAHMITNQAFNAFLKTLEEPNETTKFILATTDPLKIPSTVLSRVQHFRFKNIAQQDIINRVAHILAIEKVQYEEKAISILSRSGKGSMRDTLTLLEQAIIYSKNNITTSSVIDMLGLIDPKAIEEIFDLLLNKDIEKIKEKIKELEKFELETIIDEFSIYLQDKLFENNDKFNTILIDRFFRILSDSKHLLFINSSPSFVLTLMMFKFIEALNLKDINSVIQELEEQTQEHIQEHTEQKTSVQTQTQKEESIAKVSMQKKEEKEINQENNFKILLGKIYDKNSQVGECFSGGISFISFENNILKLQNNITSSECKKLLKLGSAQIRTLVKDIFGIQAQIEFTTSNKQEEKTSNTSINEKPITEPVMQISNVHQLNKNNTIDTNSNQDLPIKTNQEENIKDLPIIKKAVSLFGLEEEDIQDTSKNLEQ